MVNKPMIIRQIKRNKLKSNKNRKIIKKIPNIRKKKKIKMMNSSSNKKKLRNKKS